MWNATSGSLFLGNAVLFEWSHKRLLFLDGLEATMAKLGGCVDELQINLLQGTSARLHKQRLAQSQHPLFGPNHTALQHDEVVGHLSVMDKATQGGNALV